MLGAAIALLSAQAASGPQFVEELIANSKVSLPAIGRRRCADAAEAGEIVVCGRREGEPNPNRLPLPVDPPQGERLRGEIGNGTQALAETERCLRLCHQGVRIDVLQAISVLGKVADRIANGE